MTEKLKMRSMDKVQYNIEKIRELFPNAVTEAIGGYYKDKNGNEKPIMKLKVDFDILKQELSDTLIDERELRYQFTWPDKQKAILLANTSVPAALRPDKEKSVDFDNTQNLYIEGDNLDVLKLIRETYLGKIKMIYIDPPYNTGSDFVYEDDFSLEAENYKYGSGQYDEERNRLFPNTESNGRFHTDWLNMIYPRLKVAKDLLSDDGVIFISIDDNEVDNLRKICNEIFGERNFVGQIVRVSSPSQNIAKFISIMHDYTLVYCKNKEANGGDWKVEKNYADEFERRASQLLSQGLDEEEIAAELRALTKYPRFFDFDHYTMCDKKGVFQLVSMGGVDKGNETTVLYHPVTKKPCAIPQGGWRYKESVLSDLVKRDEIYYGPDETVVPRRKYYLKDYLMQIPKGVNFYDTQSDVRFLKANGIPFDFPKPKDYIAYFAKMINTKSDDIILDFFSGSATTAHAVMQLNAEDGERRRFIMVQLPEPCDVKSEAYRAGFKTICDIGEERIRRAGEKIKEEMQKSKQQGKDVSGATPRSAQNGAEAQLDVGFRVLRLDSSNMREVYYHPEQYSQSLLDDLTDNIKEDRTPLDLLFQVMLDSGVKPSAKIEEREIAGKHVFIVNANELIACFDSEITDEVVKAIAEKRPTYAAFRDSSYAADSVAANFEQIFATYSPNTRKEIL